MSTRANQHSIDLELLVRPWLFVHQHAAFFLQEWCEYRYLLVLESGAWTTKHHQLLACGFVLFNPPITYPGFFLRALTPGVDYVELAANNFCEDMLGVHETSSYRLLRPLQQALHPLAVDVPPAAALPLQIRWRRWRQSLLRSNHRGGLQPVELLAPMFQCRRTAQNDFQPPRYLRAKGSGGSIRPEDAMVWLRRTLALGSAAGG